MKVLAALAGAAAFAIVMAAGANAQQSGQKAFCLQKDTGGLVDCSYDTMEQCRKAMTGSTGTCSPRKATGDGQKQPKKK